jgi:hypothetical protein
MTLLAKQESAGADPCRWIPEGARFAVATPSLRPSQRSMTLLAKQESAEANPCRWIPEGARFVVATASFPPSAAFDAVATASRLPSAS